MAVTGERDIVKPDDGNVIGYTYPDFSEGAQRAEGSGVVCGKDSVE